MKNVAENKAIKCPFSGGRISIEGGSRDVPFVEENSIVRKIWSSSDTILFIFAGASAEFALHKTVDWLYFTGKLPNDPLGRLFSTVEYARKIILASDAEAHRTITTMAKIHAAVEKKRGFPIPDWAYQDVLFMLIFYSIAAFELLERKMTDDEKTEVYRVFSEVGRRMGIRQLPENYAAWLDARASHLEENLQKSEYADDLFRQYKKHLGSARFKVLLEAQKLVVPQRVKTLLRTNHGSLLSPAVPVYKLLRKFKLDSWVKAALLPPAYKTQIYAMDVPFSENYTTVAAVKAG